MARTLKYVDAVRLLSDQDSAVVSTLDSLAGGALIAGAVALTNPLMLGLLDAKTELARLGHDVVRRTGDRRSGRGRSTRTRRLHAAQEVLVVTAFFEVLSEADLPFRFTDLELTAAEQVSLAGVVTASSGATVVLDDPLTDLLAPFPASTVEFFHSGPVARQRLLGRYDAVGRAVAGFVQGLAAWDRLDDTARGRFLTAVEGLPRRASERFEELVRRLAGEVAEVAVWVDQLAHEETRTEIAGTRADVVDARDEIAGLRRSVETALAGLERRLSGPAPGRDPDPRRAGLALAYRAALARPIADGGDDADGGRLPAGPVLPTLGEAYLPPSFRATKVGAEPFRGGRDRLSDEDWWSRVPVQEDLEGFLARYLTSPNATTAPLLVLGQPGSGKSVLTKVLAARLPANDFLTVRVVLRDVPAAASIQDQIEHAIRVDTGERLDWPELARSAGDAMPVVLLDGFDELLQATGVSQTDYLTRVAAFQRREADQQRPLAVLVTTRTSVANRATAPEDSVAVRLEPFDDVRVTAWATAWNRVNEGWFAQRALAPFRPDAALANLELATQPLLLLMLALYDADGNALQHPRPTRPDPSGPDPSGPAPTRPDPTRPGDPPGPAGGGLGRGELYERLLHSFARREVSRRMPGAPDSELAAAAELELQRLSVVALAMFNRGAQWIGESDLEADLGALFGTATPRARHDLRSPVRAAGLLVGRFFFIHRARASSHDAEQRLETYEFLHATFAEFLVARFAWHVLRDIAARDAATTLSFGADPVDDDLLHALLSFAALSARAPIVGFLTEFATALDGEARAPMADLVVRLFRIATGPAVRRERYTTYEPIRLPVPARYAAHTANLLLLAVCLAGEVRASRLFPAAVDPVEDWHALALVWRAHLNVPEGWSSMVDTLAVDRVRDGGRRDVRLTLDDGTFTVPPVDLAFLYDDLAGAERAGSPGLAVFRHHHPDVLRRKAHFLCGNLDDVAMHSLEPLFRMLPEAVNSFLTGRGRPPSSVAYEVLATLLLNPAELERRRPDLVPFLPGPDRAASSSVRRTAGTAGPDEESGCRPPPRRGLMAGDQER